MEIYLVAGLIVLILCALPWWINYCDEIGIAKARDRDGMDITH